MQSLMVSDFLTAEWGRLYNNERFFFFFSFLFLLHSLAMNHLTERPELCSNQARTAMDTSTPKELIAQVNRTIEIFEAKDGLAQGLFMFNNAPSHLKHAED